MRNCAGQLPPLRRKYTVRVLIPCYKESLAITQRTVLAARRADKPAGTRVIIYICDDGADPQKADWVCACLTAICLARTLNGIALQACIGYNSSGVWLRIAQQFAATYVRGLGTVLGPWYCFVTSQENCYTCWERV